jgi:hypothetical protein
MSAMDESPNPVQFPAADCGPPRASALEAARPAVQFTLHRAAHFIFFCAVLLGVAARATRDPGPFLPITAALPLGLAFVSRVYLLPTPTRGRLIFAFLCLFYLLAAWMLFGWNRGFS